jgi:toxin CcdB
MARYDLYRLPDGTFVVDIQALQDLPRRVVIPFLPPARAGQPVRGLHPVLPVQGQPLLLATHLMASVPVRELGPAVGSLAGQGEIILAAVDLLLTGI